MQIESRKRKLSKTWKPITKILPCSPKSRRNNVTKYLKIIKKKWILQKVERFKGSCSPHEDDDDDDDDDDDNTNNNPLM